MRIPIAMQRLIVRHLANSTLSNRAVARLVGVSPNTVGELRIRLQMSGQDWAQLAELDDDSFAVRLGSARAVSSNKAIPDWSAVQRELQQRDITLSLLHHEYLQALRDEPDKALCYSQFTTRYRQWLKTQRVSMRQQHKPGDKLFIDFCGKTMPIADATSGVVRQVQVFVAVLGASGYTFACALPSQKVGDWLDGHVRAFRFFGGVPRQLVPDNLKSAVISHSAAQLTLNRAYADLADHYQCVINPARSRKPRDKSLAEVGVQIVQRWVLALLRHRTFFSIEELNAEITRRIGQLNDKTSKAYMQSRRERFEQLDRPALLALPSAHYEASQWRYNVRVPDDYHVEHGGSHYSVPHQYTGHRVDLRTSANMLEILLGGRRIASHALRTTPGQSTSPEHMPEAHRRQQQDDPDMLLAWAGQIGQHTLEWVRQNLRQRRDYANGLKSARRLRRWVREEQNADRLESACQYALGLNLLGFARLREVIKRNVDLLPAPDTTAWIKTHENVRGAAYFSAQHTEGATC